MQQISFTIAHLLEATFTILPVLGWLPPLAFAATIFLGLIYWLSLQAKYDRKAKKDGTLA